MAFGDFESSPSLKNAIQSSNAFSGIVIPSNGWQLEVINMPFTTTYGEIDTLFAKYGSIERIGLIYKLKERTVNCYLSYENESGSEAALKENGKKVGVSIINVIRFSNREDKGNKRPRTDDNGWGSEPTSSGGWGSTPSNNGWGSADDTSASPSASRGRGGGRGGTRGGGNGGSRACFKCGEDGHMSRECPKGGGSAGGRGCFKCGEEGHMSRECPKGGGSNGSRACFKCGEEGHMSRECPKGGGRGCFNCGEEGHMSRECSKPRSGRGRGRGGGGNFGNRGADTNNTASEWGSSETSTPVSSEGWD